MKICRYLMREASSSDTASPHYGLIEGENVIEISGPPWGQWSRGSRSSRLADARLLAPVEPTKIVCIGRNYAAHAAEMGNEVPKEPLMFLKPPSSIIGPEEAIVLTKYSQRVEHEGELAIVIGRRCSQLLETHVNGARRQSGLTSLMIYPPAFLVRWISRMMTLMPGDVIATGTPAGVGPLVAGDTVEVSVAGVGVLRNPVHAPQA